MDSKFLLHNERTEEGGAIETACVPICFSAIKCVQQSHWSLNDQLFVSTNLLIFVGSTKVECMLKHSESMERKRDRTNNPFKIGAQLSLNVTDHPSGWEDDLYDFQKIDQLQVYTDSRQRKLKPIIFVGHSLGGAVATLATLWVLGKRLREIFFFRITFGCSLVGDERLVGAVGREN